MKGWIKLHRSILNWEWYADMPTRVLFLHLLLSANYKNQVWRGQEIPRGSCLTSLRELAKQTGLTVKQVRRAMANLERTHDVVSKRTQLCTVISLCNYETYQSSKEDEGTQKGTQEGTQKGTATIERRKEIKNIRWDNYPNLDNDAFREAWEQKLEHRRQRKDKPWTEITVKQKLKTFNGWGSAVAIAALQQSVENNWAGVFYPKGQIEPVMQTEAAPSGWRDTLKKLKDENPHHEDLVRTNLNWDWSDLPPSVKVLIQ